MIGQQQSPLEIIVIKDGKELKLGMDINVNIKWVVQEINPFDVCEPSLS